MEQISTLFCLVMSLKYNGPICPIILNVIGQFDIENALQDLDASVICYHIQFISN